MHNTLSHSGVAAVTPIDYRSCISRNNDNCSTNDCNKLERHKWIYVE